MKIRIIVGAIALLFSSVSIAENWVLAYEHDKDGNGVSGSYSSLIESFGNGAGIRLFINDYKMMINPTYCKIDATDSFLLCQVSFHGANDKELAEDVNEIDIFTTNGERLYQTYSMSGTYKGSFSDSISIKWFVNK